MTIHKLVLVPFPFDDLSSTKVRPALCLTNPIGRHRHVVMAFITSRVSPNPSSTDLMIAANDPDFSSTGLRVTSTVRVHRLMTATTGLILRSLGDLSPRMISELDGCLRELIALKPPAQS